MKKNIINIYLTQLEYKRLNDLKEKYHVSYSTIANTVVSKINLVLNQESIEKINYETKGKKTSIKPKNKYNWNSPTKIYTNCLKLFLNKDLKEYIKDKKKVEKIYNFIHQELQETYEPNYNGNYLHRILPRIVKANKEYYRKILEE